MWRLFPLLIFLLLGFSALAQKASIYGVITDIKDKQPLIGVTVVIKGTSFGAITDIDGKYRIEHISAGSYNIECSYIGYEKMLFTGIKLKDGESKQLNVEMKTSAFTIDQNIVIIGQKPLVDVEDAKSVKQVGKDVIETAPNRNIQGILNTQTGVVQNPEGIHIRGGRTYETGFFIDDVSATDPLAGTGFGIDIGSNAIDNIEVNTSSSDVDYGNATAGVVNTKTRSGGNKFSANAVIKQDNFGFNKNWNSSYNQTIAEISLGGPLTLKKSETKSRLKYFVSGKVNFSDTYIKKPADQLYSSIYTDQPLWSPREDNRWAIMTKWNYDLSQTKKLSFTYLKSLNINQDVNMLRITGNDIGYMPGYQFEFMQSPDNANTFTHDANMQVLQYINTPKPTYSYRITLSRLFVHLRADANGRPWRPEVVNTEFDPRSIVDFPTTIFNPNDSIVFVYPSSGFYNNGGIATLWHDHYVESNTLKFTNSLYSRNTLSRLYFGAEIKSQEMRWIDITRPWIGAPIQLANGEYTQSFRLGDLSDVWKATLIKGAFFLSEKYKFRGLIADVGLRYEYWFPGKFVDDAINNTQAPIPDAIRENYLNNTVSVFGHRMKMRILPKLAASFPIKENQIMYFNYGHSMVDPHPSYIYTGLDPNYADRSTLRRVGNPDLNPEVDISYELGLKSQITQNDALTVSAYWKDKYDFITSASVLIQDASGREVARTIRINSDYARVRGLELSYTKRIKKWFESSTSFSYSISTGQSNSANQSLAEILQTGNTVSAKELYLVWDSPIDAKTYALIRWNEKDGLWGKKWLNKFSVYTEAIYRTGRRYTPYLFKGYEPFSGRPIYEMDNNPNNRYSKLSVSNFWLNISGRKWFKYKKTEFALTFEINNVLNSKNSVIINPVTGRAWRIGDDVPTEWRDPRYIDPRDSRSYGLPPDNPARYYEQRHFLIGLTLRFG